MILVEKLEVTVKKTLETLHTNVYDGHTLHKSLVQTENYVVLKSNVCL